MQLRVTSFNATADSNGPARPGPARHRHAAHDTSMERSGAPEGGMHTDGGAPTRAPRWAEPEDVSSAPDDCVLTAAQVPTGTTCRLVLRVARRYSCRCYCRV